VHRLKQLPRSKVDYRYLVQLAFFIGCLLLFKSVQAEEGLSYHLSPVSPQQAKNFTLADMDNQKHSLKDYLGKVVMINFWATWCPPCRQEMPSMEALYQRFKTKGFTILAINQWETPDRVFVYTGEFSLPPTFPILFDQKGEIADMFTVKGLPTTILVNKKGQVVYRAIGGRDFNHPEVDRIILALINEK